MEETVRKVSAIFDKMASVKITPTSNYSVPEYWMYRAIKGDEKCKDNLFNWISLSLNIDKSILNAVFNAKYNKINENKVMNKKLVRLTESDLHKIVKESVKIIMEEYYPVNSNDFAKDYRLGAKGYVNGSANMPNPKYDDVAPYSKYIGDYYSAPYRDSDQMYRDNVGFNKREHNKQTVADRRWMNAADSRPLHRKGSLNREF